MLIFLYTQFFHRNTIAFIESKVSYAVEEQLLASICNSLKHTFCDFNALCVNYLAENLLGCASITCVI